MQHRQSIATHRPGLGHQGAEHLCTCGDRLTHLRRTHDLTRVDAGAVVDQHRVGCVHLRRILGIDRGQPGLPGEHPHQPVVDVRRERLTSQLLEPRPGRDRLAYREELDPPEKSGRPQPDGDLLPFVREPFGGRAESMRAGHSGVAPDL